MNANHHQLDATQGPTFTVSEPLCAAYCQLFARDFSAAEVNQSISNDYSIDMEGFEDKLSSFHEGLSHGRLELSGRLDDVSGWLLCYVEAYVDPKDVRAVFPNSPALTDAEVEALTTDANRLSPILKSAWTAAIIG